MRRALILLAISWPAFSQLTNTVYQLLVTNSSAIAATSPVRNIGQASHSAKVTFTNAPSHTCLAGAVDVGWEQSFDGVLYSRFGDQLAAIALNADGQLSTVIQAYGAFPYVRIKVRAFDTTNCLVSIGYSGTVAGQANITLTAGSVSVTGPVRTIIRSTFTNDYDSDLVDVPNTLTVLTAANTLVSSIFCNNYSAGSVTLTITNAAGKAYVGPAFPLGALANGVLFQLPRGQLATGGLKWQASAATSIACQVVGMQ